MTKEDRKYDIEERLIDFAVRIIKTAETLPRSKVGIHIAGQLIRCGTSPAANYGEAQSAESRNDFIHKMKICLKELRETRVWLLMIIRSKLIKPLSKLDSLIQENNELISIFATSINTAKVKLTKKKASLFLNYTQLSNSAFVISFSQAFIIQRSSFYIRYLFI